MQDKILEIAKNIDFKNKLCIRIISGDSGQDYVTWEDTDEIFNPYENDADAFKVLEALVKAGKEVLFLDCEELSTEEYKPFPSVWSRVLEVVGDNLRSSICEAYLSLIQQEEG